jgi:hypothetical protein
LNLGPHTWRAPPLEPHPSPLSAFEKEAGLGGFGFLHTWLCSPLSNFGKGLGAFYSLRRASRASISSQAAAAFAYPTPWGQKLTCHHCKVGVSAAHSPILPVCGMVIMGIITVQQEESQKALSVSSCTRPWPKRLLLLDA